MDDDRRVLIDRILRAEHDVSLAQAVADLRADGLGWRRVSRRLGELYNVDVSFHSLARWYGPIENGAASD